MVGLTLSAVPYFNFWTSVDFPAASSPKTTIFLRIGAETSLVGDPPINNQNHRFLLVIYLSAVAADDQSVILLVGLKGDVAVHGETLSLQHIDLLGEDHLGVEGGVHT